MKKFIKKKIKDTTGEDSDGSITGIKVLQRIFKISPNSDTASPLLKNDIHDSRQLLLENDIHIALEIANIPREKFINTYGNALGSDSVAFAIHQQASCVSKKTIITFMQLLRYSKTHKIHEPYTKLLDDVISGKIKSIITLKDRFRVIDDKNKKKRTISTKSEIEPCQCLTKYKN